MEAVNILQADVLDILFNNRNKAYGAYDLRKHYQRRLLKSMAIMMATVALLLATYLLLAAAKPASVTFMQVKEIQLAKVNDIKKVETPPVVLPPVRQIPPVVKTTIFTTPLIVKGNVPVEEKPPLNSDLDAAKIGTVNTDGIMDNDITGPPVDANKGVVDAPKKQDTGDDIFRTVEIESQYPGGMPAWSAFLYRNLVYPQQAIDNGQQGTVYVQFIVDTNGQVSNVTAISGPEELRAAAVNVIKKSGRWTPAIQNGRNVKSYKKQPVTFRLQAD